MAKYKDNITTEYKIYAIMCSLTETYVYVGSTKRTLDERLGEHRKDVKHPEKLSWLFKNNHEIVLLEENLTEFGCLNREQYYIDIWNTANLLNRQRAVKKSYSDALKDAKQRIKDMKKGNN